MPANYTRPYNVWGFKHIKGTWNQGWVIKSISEQSEFVWIADYYDAVLKPNNLETDFLDFANPELEKSVRKYGGFYIARYMASKEGFSICFKNDKTPLTDLNFLTASKKSAEYMNTSEEMGSCLPSGGCWDAMCNFIVESGQLTEEEVLLDSTLIGGYSNSEKAKRRIVKTGTGKSVCNIYDLTGNCSEWTSELCGEFDRVTRGGYFYKAGDEAPLAARTAMYPNAGSHFTGFRAVIYKKV